MAAARSTSRRYVQNAAHAQQMYVHGNNAVKPEYAPGYYEPERRDRDSASRRSRKQNRAQRVNKAYVVFLALAAAVTLAVCVNYIQLRSELTARSKNISVLQERLASINEENTTKYNVIMDSVNLDEVRTKAMNELGMVYASENQIVQYENKSGSYITQYEEIPEEGVLADSFEAKD